MKVVAQVVKLVGEPSDKQHFALMGSKISMCAYKSDTVMISFLNGKSGKVMNAKGIEEFNKGLNEMNKTIDESKSIIDSMKSK